MNTLKEILIISGALIFLGVTLLVSPPKDTPLIVGAPTLSYQRSLLPITTSLYDIGSSTQSLLWNRLFVNYASTTAVSVTNLDISGTCTGCSSIADTNDWSFDTNFGEQVLTASTTIPIWLKDTLYASSTSFFDGLATFGNATATQLTLTDLYISGDQINDFAGTGLTVTGNALTADLGTSIDISDETNLTGGVGLTLTGDDMACDTASGSVFGCLASADWTTFNNKQSAISATFPIVLTGSALSFGGLSTSTSAVLGNIPYFSGVNTFDNVATTTLTASSPLSLSQPISVIGSSASVLSVSVTGDWTGTIDGNNFAGGQIGVGELIYGGSAGSFSELGVSTNGFVLALSSGVPAWVATTTFSGGLTYSAGNVTADLGASIDLTSGEVVDNFTDGSVLFWGTTAISEDNADFSYSSANNRLTATYASSTAISATNADFTGITEGGIPVEGERFPIFSYASSSWASAGTTTLRLAPAAKAQTWNTIRCDSSTFLGISVYDGTNRMNYFEASSTVGAVTLTTNNSFTLGEIRRVDIGTSTALGTRVDIGCSAIYEID